MTLTVINHITLDGVMQSPGSPDEDSRGGFTHGGWAIRGSDPAMYAAMGPHMSKPSGGLLLGRRSYEQMLSYWNTQHSPYRDALNNTAKYVVSRTPDTGLDWPNSTLVHGDIPGAVKELARTTDLVIMGSGQLIRALLPYGLIDEFLLMIHPIVLGSGQRLFEQDGHVAALRLTECAPTATGVIIATYRPADDAPHSATGAPHSATGSAAHTEKR
ncbi:dihydrofolate reductase family protein [Nocardia callitridis]